VPPAPQLSEAELQAQQAERKTPPAQQEFEPAASASTSASASAASTAAPEPAPVSPPARSGGGAEEFAP